MEIKTLRNGKRVANYTFSSDLHFQDGTVLGAVSPVKAMTLLPHTELVEGPQGDVKRVCTASTAMLQELDAWLALQLRGDVDVVFIPWHMLAILEDIYGMRWLQDSPFRAPFPVSVPEDPVIFSVDKQYISWG